MLDAISFAVMWLLIGLFLGGPIILLSAMVVGAVWDGRSTAGLCEWRPGTSQSSRSYRSLFSHRTLEEVDRPDRSQGLGLGELGKQPR